MHRNDETSNFFSTTDIDIEEMLRVAKDHKDMLDRLESELEDDLEEFTAIIELLQIIRDAQSIELDEMLDHAAVEFKIHKIFKNADEYASSLEINELAINYRLSAELNLAIHAIFEAMHDEVCRHVEDAEHAKNILQFLLDCR